jgi:hypothetical protein
MDVLKASEQALNGGALTEQLTGVADDYQATLCPSGATDTLSLTIHFPADRQRALLKRSEGITQALNHILTAQAAQTSFIIDRPSLAECLFTQTRQQALAQRFAAVAPVKSGPARLTTSTPYSLLTTPANGSAHKVTLNARTTPPASVISKVGDSGCTGLPPHWFGGFYPERKITLPALAQKRLAAQGISLLQNTTPHGSWLCAHGAKPLADALSDIMQQAWLAPLPSPTGLQAHRLLAELTPSPDMPFMWADSSETTATLSPLITALPEAQTPFAQEVPHPTSPLATLMRTLTLPGSATHRWLMAMAAQRHSTPFFHAMRHTHRLGYIAAVRFIDGDPASMAYIVQCPQADTRRVKSLLQDEIARLWSDLLTHLAADWFLAGETVMGIEVPETPAAVLVAQWRAHLNATHTPLYRLPPPAPAHFSDLSVDDWRNWLADPAHWAWWQRAG